MNEYRIFGFRGQDRFCENIAAPCYFFELQLKKKISSYPLDLIHPRVLLILLHFVSRTRYIFLFQ